MSDPDPIGGIDRSVNKWWHSGEITPEMPSGMFDLLETRMNESVEQMVKNLNISLYSDGEATPPTRRQMFRWKWRKRWERVRNAWLVLTGQAYIDDGDY
jgi:hypothetical protein